jgi:hypothetical protein
MIILDTSTLLMVNALIAVFLACAMAFFKATQKTYPGFDTWTVAILIVPICYVLFILRGLIPDLGSKVLSNTGFTFTATLLLAGTRMFLNRPRLHRSAYLLPGAAFLVVTTFTYIQDSPIWRNAAITVVISLMSWATAWEFQAHGPSEGRKLYRTMAVILAFYGVVLLARAIILFRTPDYNLLAPSPVQTVYFLVVSVFQLIWGLGFVMLNSQRLTQELLETQRSLSGTVTSLEKALTEVKTLRGLLPICAACKKIRDDQGYWQQIEGYIQERSEAQFSHSLCPECLEKLYPSIVPTREQA